MKITKFAQSCVLFETQSKKILIDPSDLLLDDSTLKKWMDVDIILVTHKHGDHCDDKSINEIMKNAKVKLYTTKEVRANHEISPTKIVKQGDVLNFGGIKIEVVKAVHGYVSLMKGRFVHEAVGFIIDDGKVRVYHTGDTLAFETDYKCDILLAPICNHAVVMGPWEAGHFANEVGAKLLIPLHYDAERHPVDMKYIKEELAKSKVKYRFLKIGESIGV